MNIYFKSDFFNNMNNETRDAIIKYIFRYYEFLDIKFKEIKNITNDNLLLKEQNDQLETDSQSFLEDADKAEDKNIKLKLRILKLRNKCIYKNKLILSLKITSSCLFTLSIYDHFSFYYGFCRLLINIPIYYFYYLNIIFSRITFVESQIFIYIFNFCYHLLFVYIIKYFNLHNKMYDKMYNKIKNN